MHIVGKARAFLWSGTSGADHQRPRYHSRRVKMALETDHLDAKTEVGCWGIYCFRWPEVVGALDYIVGSQS